MSLIDTKSKFHVALDGQGLILQGAPDRISYQQGQAPLYGQRFASGDRSYNDLSSWWYFVQTSWAAGIKDTVSWLDDAKHYYSTNIDTWSENGAIKLTRLPVLNNTFTEDIYCGGELEVNSETVRYIGTTDSASNEPVIYRYNGSSYVDIASGQLTSGQNIISQLSARAGILWASIVGAGTTNVVVTWNGTTFTDQSAYIYNAGATISFQPTASRCHTTYQNTQYVFVDDVLNYKYALVKTTTTNPSAAGNWSKVFERTSDTGYVVSVVSFDAKIYYLISRGNAAELRVYDIATDTDSVVNIFQSAILQWWGRGDKYLVVLNGKLVITIPTKEIWTIDSSSNLVKVFTVDEYKRTSLPAESRAYLESGAVISDNKAWWGNLMYDGTYFHNTYKEVTDSTTSLLIPLFVDSLGYIWHTDSVNQKKLYSTNLAGSVYKGTADKNFVIFNNFDNISGIDKMAYSATIIFKPLVSGQKIAIEYTTGELTSSTSWTSLGSASHSIDSGVVTDKTLYFPVGTNFKKIWVRVKLEATSGTDTPTMTDFVMEYLPTPSYKKNWTVNINCADEVKTLSGRLSEYTGRELKGRLERSWWTKSVLDFQDLDYVGTLLNETLTESDTTITVDTTRDFPEQGRIRIDDEEITYTGKTQATFTGCVRGARSTRATTHADNAVVNNAYKVIITDMSSRVPMALEGKELEYVMGISLREV
jgi:hypothetical protein